MRISDWSSDVCLPILPRVRQRAVSNLSYGQRPRRQMMLMAKTSYSDSFRVWDAPLRLFHWLLVAAITIAFLSSEGDSGIRSEEHTSELQSLMRISYAVFCLKKKKKDI